MSEKAKIIAVSVSDKKGIKKRNVLQAELKEGFGLMADAHAGAKNRQVSLLADESIEKMRKKGLKVEAGDFAENITTQGLDLLTLKIGDRLRIGKNTILEISQIGKECRTPCAIYYQAGDCVMPKEGVFAKVIRGGIIKPEDEIQLIEENRGV